ncbi:305_t:CDS:2, partial [Gigaspora rosea]
DRRLKDYAGPWTILHYLVEEILKPKGYVLYYQQPDLSKSENSAEHYYQLTVSDEFWLCNGRDFGQACFGVDGKYDLNIDRAPVLTMVVENSARHGTSLAFENNWSIRLAINAVKQNNDPTCEHSWYYEDLPNNKGFRRIRNCINQVWNPYAMIDKHYPTKLGVEGL